MTQFLNPTRIASLFMTVDELKSAYPFLGQGSSQNFAFIGGMFGFIGYASGME
jgi:hypothetical protein